MKKQSYTKQAKDNEVEKLKRRVKKLESENRRLKSELNAYESAFRKTSRFIKDHSQEITLEGLIDAAKKDKSLKEAQDDSVEEVCSKCLNTDFKVIPTKFGSVKLCSNCGHREVQKDEQ